MHSLYGKLASREEPWSTERPHEENILPSISILIGFYMQHGNRRHGLDDQLFCGRYKSAGVEADRYLLELLCYIHQNPLLLA